MRGCAWCLSVIVWGWTLTTHAQEATETVDDSETAVTGDPSEAESGDGTEGGATQETAPEERISPERADAQRRYAIAVERADAGDCELAIAELEEIYRLLENPVVFFNMAICYEELARYDRAIESYERYLAEAAPDADARGEVERALRRLEGFLGTVRVASNVPAAVWIDDREVGESPGEFRVPAGSHAVEVRAAGHESAQQEVVVASGRTAELSFTLEELAEEYEGLAPGYFWASSILGVLSLGAAVGIGIKALQQNHELRDRAESGGLVTDQDNEDVRRLSLSADVLYGATGLFAAGALIFAFLTDWRDSDSTDPPVSEVRLVPTLSRQTAGLSLGGSF